MRPPGRAPTPGGPWRSRYTATRPSSRARARTRGPAAARWTTGRPRHGRDQVDVPRRPQLARNAAQPPSPPRGTRPRRHRTARRTRHRATTSGVAASAAAASEFRGAPTATSRTAIDDVLFQTAGPRYRAASTRRRALRRVRRDPRPRGASRPVRKSTSESVLASGRWRGGHAEAPRHLVYALFSTAASASRYLPRASAPAASKA